MFLEQSGNRTGFGEGFKRKRRGKNQEGGDEDDDGGDGEDDDLYGGSGNDIFSDYDNETNSVELIDELKESDLTCSYVGVDKQIKYENDLMAIIQNTIAEDFTFI